MILGIDCSRFAAEKPTGVELYTDRIVEGLIRQSDQLGVQKLKCYVKTALQLERLLDLIDERRQVTVEPVLIERKRLWTVFGLSWEMLRRPPDVLFVPSHTLPLISPSRSVLTVHGVEALLFPKAYSWFQSFLQGSSLRKAKRKKARLIAVSKSVKKDLIRFFDYPPKQIDVVWNGYDVFEPSVEMKRADFHRIVSGDFILSVGRLEERKNQKRLVSAFEQISSQYPDLKLVLVGPDGYGSEEIRRMISVSLVHDRIILAGYQSRDMVRDLFSHARLFAYPSLAEGFGIPLLEAFSAGCPVLTSRGSATEEIGGDAVEYCDPFSSQSIADGLSRLLRERKLAGQRVRSGKERLEHFSWEKCVKGTIQVLRSLI